MSCYMHVSQHKFINISKNDFFSYCTAIGLKLDDNLFQFLKI